MRTASHASAGVRSSGCFACRWWARHALIGARSHRAVFVLTFEIVLTFSRGKAVSGHSSLVRMSSQGDGADADLLLEDQVDGDFCGSWEAWWKDGRS